jgi:hypothetical protein
VRYGTRNQPAALGARSASDGGATRPRPHCIYNCIASTTALHLHGIASTPALHLQPHCIYIYTCIASTTAVHLQPHCIYTCSASTTASHLQPHCVCNAQAGSHALDKALNWAKRFVVEPTHPTHLGVRRIQSHTFGDERQGANPIASILQSLSHDPIMGCCDSRAC